MSRLSGGNTSLVVGGKLLIASEAAVALGKLRANAIDRFSDRSRESVNDFLGRVLLQVAHGFCSEELKNLAGFKIFMEQHEELLFGRDGGAAE